jgi:hypothetical protein
MTVMAEAMSDGFVVRCAQCGRRMTADSRYAKQAQDPHTVFLCNFGCLPDYRRRGESFAQLAARLVTASPYAAGRAAARYWVDRLQRNGHAGRRHHPFDAGVLADIAVRAAELRPLPPPPPRAPDWGQPATWRNTDRQNCLRIAVSTAFGVPLDRVPVRPSNPSDEWADEFQATLRRGGLDLELIPGRELEVGTNERWVALIEDHAVAMCGRAVLFDSAKRWQPGEQLDVPVLTGFVRRRVKTDRWGKPLP